MPDSAETLPKDFEIFLRSIMGSVKANLRKLYYSLSLFHPLLRPPVPLTLSGALKRVGTSAGVAGPFSLPIKWGGRRCTGEELVLWQLTIQISVVDPI
jgi:hypothetical protein